MFQLLQPIWLFALAGLSIPVIIHLWNRRPGKIRKIGSVAFLTASSKEYARQLKLSDLLLLLLRCLLLTLLAFVLANPVWQQLPGAAKQKGWVLMDKKNAQQTYARFKPAIDSLLAAGFEMHDFSAGFKKETLREALEPVTDTSLVKPASYWNLVAILNEQVSETLPLHLFTGSNMENFGGVRPKVSLQLTWHSFVPADTVTASIAGAYLTTGDSIRVVVQNTEPSATFYTFDDLPLHTGGNKNFNISTGEHKWFVSLNNSKPFFIDTSTLRISIFTDKYLQDANYLQAAIEAIQQFSKRKIKSSVIHTVPAIPAQQDWLFWLTDMPLQTKAEAVNLFKYETGTTLYAHTWITDKNDRLSADQLPLYKYVKPGEAIGDDAQTIWEDGFGRPLLTWETKNGKDSYRFFSHFDPAWNDLPWNSGFPALIYSLLDKREANAGLADASDRRIIGSGQLQPVFLPAEKSTDTAKQRQNIDLSGFFWLAIFVLFFIERLISFQNKKGKRNG